MGVIYSVKDINRYIKNMFDNDLLMRNLQVKGEISNVVYHSSGHIYFTLKEEGTAIKGVMFKTYRERGLDFRLQNGQNLIVSGFISVFERDGQFQLYATAVSLDGRGNLYEAYELLKQKLYEEGLFEFEFKKEIPKFPKKVGIVTARTGAAIQDIMNIAKRRNPYVQLYLYPAQVQGECAAKTIVKGIKTLDAMGMDTIIIGRGGGSIEDLWAFNEEIVARAIFEANTPIISGTGHEIDNTIADYVADLRAPTPSAAAELAIPDVVTALQQVKQYEYQLAQRIHHNMDNAMQKLQMLSVKLDRLSPENKLHNQMMYLDSLQDRLTATVNQKFVKAQHRYAIYATRLHGLSPTAKLVGGFGYVETEEGTALRSVDDVKKDSNIVITVSDGQISAVVDRVEKNGGVSDAK